jgi:hypothetical protein
MRAFEVVDAKEQTDTTCELFADGTRLIVAISPSQQQSRARVWGSHDDPTLRPPVVGHRRRVLDKLEAQRIDEEANGIVVVLDDQGKALEMHSATLRRLRRAARRSNSTTHISIAAKPIGPAQYGTTALDGPHGNRGLSRIQHTMSSA